MRQSAVGSVLALAVMGSLTWTVSAAAAPPSCVDEVATETSARVMASECHRTVEVLDARTSWNTLVAQPDGTMRLDVSAAALRTRTDGSWKPVDSSLERTSGGLEVASAVTPMTFSDGRDGQPLASIERDGHRMTFDVPFDLPAPTVAGNQLTYAAVIPGVDLIVTVDEDTSGFREVIRVASPEAAADPRFDELRFAVGTSPDLSVSAARGGFEARDHAGATVFSSPVPEMWDSRRPALPVTPTTGPARPASLVTLRSAARQAEVAELTAGEDPTVAATTGARRAAMPVAVTKGALSIRPDADMLASDDTVWPVYIDPPVSGSLNQWTAVRDVYSPKYAFNPDEGVGLCNVVAYGCTKTFKSRLLWRFAGLETLGALSSSDVVSASFSVYGTHSYNCTPQPVTLYQIPDFSSSTGWPGGASWNPLDTQTVAHRPSCGNDRWIGFNAIGMARAVADVNASIAAFGIAADESSMAYWKRYRYDAQFSITYNVRPNQPTSLSIASPARSCGSVVNTGMPTLSAVLSDPDGDNVNGLFHITDLRTGGRQDVALPTLASGSTFRIQPVTVLQDDSYKFTVEPGDGRQWGPVSAECTFTVDTVAPTAPPGVVVSSGQPATYGQNTRSGGVGLTGAFTFTNGGIADVVSYRYGFDDSAMPVAAAPGQQIAYTPTQAGRHVLYVQSVDRAGWPSPRVDYTFDVAVPTVAGLWLFDDASSSLTAADKAGKHPLTLSNTGLKVPGTVAELDPANAAAGDGALHIGTVSDRAYTAEPVVGTDTTFSVSAFVKLDDLLGTQTVVSQDGVNAVGFELGYRSGAGSGCPTSDGCWAFAMNGADSATAPARTVVASGTPVVAGEWAYLTGVYDAGAHTMSVSVCSPGGEPETAASVPFTASWYATAAFKVGRGHAVTATSPENPFRGAVDALRVTTGVPDLIHLRAWCTGSTDL